MQHSVASLCFNMTGRPTQRVNFQQHAYGKAGGVPQNPLQVGWYYICLRTGSIKFYSDDYPFAFVIRIFSPVYRIKSFQILIINSKPFTSQFIYHISLSISSSDDRYILKRFWASFGSLGPLPIWFLKNYIFRSARLYLIFSNAVLNMASSGVCFACLIICRKITTVVTWSTKLCRTLLNHL